MSKPNPGPSLIQVPNLFSVVEPGVYRCASPTPTQVPYLASLGLRTVISLTPEFPTKQLLAFTRQAGIDFLHLGTTLWRPLTDWKPVRDEIVKATLEIMLDKRAHPLLIMDPLGIHQVGSIVGCLRIMQGWNFASILIEYRAHSGPTKHRYADEQYIELFDPDVINIPPAEHLPAWFLSPGARDEDSDDIEEDDDEGKEVATAKPKLRQAESKLAQSGQSSVAVTADNAGAASTVDGGRGVG